MFLKLLSKLLFLSLFLLSTTLWFGCGGATIDACVENNPCPDDEVCVDNDGVAECQVPSGGGGGGNGAGEACESDADCQTGLVCSAGQNGVLTCMN